VNRPGAVQTIDAATADLLRMRHRQVNAARARFADADAETDPASRSFAWHALRRTVSGRDHEYAETIYALDGAS